MTNHLDLNRSSLYGDGFFETFKLIHGTCERFHLHYQRLLKSLKLLQMDWNPLWTQGYFEALLIEESKKHKESILKVRLIIYRNSSGTYLPSSNEANYYLKSEPYMASTSLTLRAGIYPLVQKPCNFLSELKSTSCLPFVMAAQYMKAQGWDEIIILNQYGRICEALTSNIFLELNGKFITPLLSEGCIDGVNRKAFLLSNPNIIEQPITVDYLKSHNLYFSNAVRGLVEGSFVI